MDPEIKRALANLRRRKAEIKRKFGESRDDGPIYGRGRSERIREFQELEEEFEDYEDDL